MAKANKTGLDALDFIVAAAELPRPPLYVLSGDQDLLKQRCRTAIVTKILGDSDAEFAVSTYSGDKLEFSQIRNELDTLPFLASSRVVFVEQADDFVSDNRASLEEYLKKPSKVGMLVLEVKSFPETTKLAKALPSEAKINVNSPEIDKLPNWAIGWAKTLRKKLSRDAATLLVQRVGLQMGLIAQELEKLSVAVPDAEITIQHVEQLVARTAEANVFNIMTAIGDNRPADAMQIVHDILQSEDVMAIVGPLAYQVRKLAAVERHLQRGQPLGAALDAAGVTRYPVYRGQTEQQIRHLGRKRLQELPEMLMELDLGLKGGSHLPREMQLERFIARLAAPRGK
jgi:DNA polymerase III subunit delta